MENLVLRADCVVLAFSIFYLYKNFKRLMWSSRSVYFLIFFALYVFPIYLDYLIGFQEHYHWGFEIASNEPATRLIYDVLLVFIMHALVFYNNKLPDSCYLSNLKNTNSVDMWGVKYKYLLLFFMVFPAFATLLFLKKIEMLYLFQWREYEYFEASGSYSSIERFTYFGIVCSVILLLDYKKRFFDFYRLLALLFLYINICIQGKRAIMFFAIVVILMVVVFHYFTFKAKGKSTFRYKIFFSSILLIGFFYMITSSVEVKLGRGYSEADNSLMYTSTRIDMFREDRVKMAIYSEMNEEKMKILDYGGQSLITNLVSIVPFNYISEPMNLSQGTYQVHFSMAMFNLPYNHINQKANRNYMTCTIFAELISNFGIIIGSLLFVIITIWFAKLTDKYPSPFNILLVSSYVLLNLFDFVYMVMFMELTFLFCIFYKRRYFANYTKLK